MRQPDYAAARQYALGRLERELEPRLCYHDLAHTRDDVLPAVERLARIEGLAGDELLLLRTAALYHDIGFTVGHAEHELAGVRIMAGVLPDFGYTAEQIAHISAQIMATCMPQAPRSLAAQILADADLDLLGRTDFLEGNRALRQELAAFENTLSDAAWYAEQLSFLSRHRYWTSAARQLRDAQKGRNILQLQALLAAALVAEASGRAE
jgi:uncharacterized protein